MRIKYGLLCLAIATIYFLSARLGLSFAFEQENISPIWPPTGISIAALFIFGYRVWPAIFIGALAVNLSTGIPVLAAIGIALGNTLEALTAVYLMYNHLPKYPFYSVGSTLKFALIVIVSTSLSATIGVSTLWFAEIITGDLFSLLWTTWWLGDLVGGIVFTPFILTMAQKPRFKIKASTSIEMLALISFSLSSAFIVFGKGAFGFQGSYDTSFLLIPTLVWAALRFYNHGATSLVVLFTFISIYSTLEGFGPFVAATNNESLLLLQLFMAIIMITSLALASSVGQAKEASQKLIVAQRNLETKVKERTFDLQKSNTELQKEIKQRLENTESMKKLLSATTLPSDSNYYHSICLELARIYRSKFAFIGLIEPNERKSVNTLSVCINDSIVNNFSYQLAGTPCQDVINFDIELVKCDAASLYPKDDMLVEMGVESYFGAPIISSENKVIGVVVTMDDKPMSIGDWIKPTLGLIASNVSFEIEKRSAKQALRLAASVYDEAVEAIAIYDSEGLIIQANRAFTTISGYSEQEAIGQDTRLLKSGRHDDTFYQQFWQSLNQSGTWQGEIWNKKKNGEIFPCWQTITVVKDSSKKVKQYISVFSDISESKKTENEIYHLAHYDVLTGLANRNYFIEILESDIENACNLQQSFALLFLDLDHFKHINDSSGHSTGDLLLIQVAKRLRKFENSDTIISRLGGDEFTLLVRDVKSVEVVEKLAEQILHELRIPYHLSNLEVVLSVSIGFCFYPDDATNVHDLLKNADIAMYKAKSEGRSKFKRFVPLMNFEAQQRAQIEQEIRTGLEQQQFEIYYQPQVNLKSGKMIGCEALVRWNHPTKGFMAPNLFIPIAEDSGLINPLGEWVLESACKQFMDWKNSGYVLEHIAVNLSARQFNEQNLVDTVKEVLLKTGIDAEHLELELTESMLMENLEESISIMSNLRQLGISLSIDDFGTGYSSLAYLKHFPIDKLKIDRSFVNDVLSSPEDATIVKTTISLAAGLGLKTIAEGVETLQQMEYLKENGCEEMQGYYFCHPLSPRAKQLVELLATTRV